MSNFVYKINGALIRDERVDTLEKQIPADYLVGGKQTTTSTEDGGVNVFTFTKANGEEAEFTVKNGSKGDAGAKGATGAHVTEITLTKDASGAITGGTAKLSDGTSVTITVTGA